MLNKCILVTLKNGTSNYIFRYQENIHFTDEFNYHPIYEVIVANKASDPISNTIHFTKDYQLFLILEDVQGMN